MAARDVVIIGAGAAGLMCAIEAGKRGRSVTLIEHAKAPAEKIRISGGGRCNFTNMHATAENFLSQNRHFAKSALKRYTQWDFVDWVNGHGIAWHEKTLGQLFCDHSAKDIIAALLKDLRQTGGELRLSTSATSVERKGEGFAIALSDGSKLDATSLVIASGGKSIPKMGATGFGYDIARQFGLDLVETRPGLVPLTFDPDTLERFKPLAGVAVDGAACHDRIRFEEAMLFTHRGLSGPAILQISSYWREGDDIRLHLRPDLDFYALLREARQANGRQAVQTALAEHLPKRLALMLVEEAAITGNLADQSDRRLRAFADRLEAWPLTPTGSEGYRTAEVTLGGVDTAGLDSRTMAARNVPGLYFIGEVVDVTGWLGGYNFQWAWSSGWSAGQVV
ncbi:NAD(P)/FAD-dependent oxidoreductase [uncultured Maricaulis sp.]|uniref:NAD(P)/FAD-dependent oxidoreductase n=1 Tax=uncultured Maricaulis sp. TaxID=174710 RepID=UPI0026241E17|nr:NAD(P)/FAD-dependent oxidoreductase [uncultured Maricaulis sp.]